MLGGSTISAANALHSMNSSSSMSSSSSALQPSSYNSDRSLIQTGLDVEFASDAASGGFFNSDYKKCDAHEKRSGEPILMIFHSILFYSYTYQA